MSDELKNKSKICKHEWHGEQSFRTPGGPLLQIRCWCIHCGLHRIKRQHIFWCEWEELPTIPIHKKTEII